MKVNGRTISGPRVHSVVLPFGDLPDDYVVFKFRALTVKDAFEEIMPRPRPPKIVKPGQPEFFDVNDENYKKSIDVWGTAKINWEFLQSISVTEGLEWGSVKKEDPQTWGNWRKDLEETFGIMDFNRIFGGFLAANSLDEERLEEARARFLASQEAQSSPL
jgi:hypothetical protein